MGILIGIWRRIFGGAAESIEWLKERGVQAAMMMLVVFIARRLTGADVLNCLLTSVAAYVFFAGGHYYYFLMGTESDEYIDEQEAKGRKPALNWLVEPLNKLIGFEPRSKEYCFIGMAVRYILYSIPLMLCVGSAGLIAGAAVPFIYAAMFYVDLPKVWWFQGPTNWAEFFTGMLIGWSIL